MQTLSDQRAASTPPARSPRRSRLSVCFDRWEPRGERHPAGLLLRHPVQTPLRRSGGEGPQEGREREAENMRNRDGDPSGTRLLGEAKPEHSPRPVRPCRGLHRLAIITSLCPPWGLRRCPWMLARQYHQQPCRLDEGHTASCRAQHLLGLSSRLFPKCPFPPYLGLATGEECNRQYTQMAFPKGADLEVRGNMSYQKQNQH